MAVNLHELSVIHYPAPVLRRRTAPVPQVTDEVRAVAARMIELMYVEEGIGLAAPQVGLPWRMFVAHVPEGEGRALSDSPVTCTAGPAVYINPELIEPEGDLEPYEEGCLSLPEIRGQVFRPPRITVRALDQEGKSFSLRGAGLQARCWQHEVDHLNGVLIIDRMTQMSRLKNRSAVRALERAGEEGPRRR